MCYRRETENKGICVGPGKVQYEKCYLSIIEVTEIDIQSNRHYANATLSRSYLQFLATKAIWGV